MAVPTPEELLELVAEMATSPRVQQANGFRRETHDIASLVKAAELLQGMIATDAAEQPHRGMRLTKLIPPQGG
jgi:hypothetical protein